MTVSANGHDTKTDPGAGLRLFSEGLRRSFLPADNEWRTLQGILDNGWTYKLDDSLSKLGGIGRISEWLSAAVSDADASLAELDNRIGLNPMDLRSAGIERMREAYRVLCQLTALRDYLKQPSDIGSVANIALERVVERFLSQDSRSLADLEAAILRFENNPGDGGFHWTTGTG